MKIFNYQKNELESLKAIFTASEIFQQPETWLKTYEQVKKESKSLKDFLDSFLKNEDYEIILTGAGTSEFVGNSVFSFLNKNCGFNFKSIATTDLVQSPLNYLNTKKKLLLVSYGRSGNSPESIAAFELVNQIMKKDAFHLFITCNKDGELNKKALNNDRVYSLCLCPETHDQSFAMTSSFSNMLLATILVFNLDKIDLMKKNIDSASLKANKVINEDFNFFKEIVNDFNFKRIVYLGANCLKGISQESALKMLELTAGKVSTLFDGILGFRHGPKSIIDNETLCVVYLSDEQYQYQYELDLIKEMGVQRKQNKILVVDNKKREEVKQYVDYYYSFNDEEKIDNVFLGLNYIMLAQLLAFYKSLSLNITVDNPCPSGEVNRVVKGVNIYPFSF